MGRIEARNERCRERRVVFDRASCPMPMCRLTGKFLICSTFRHSLSLLLEFNELLLDGPTGSTLRLLSTRPPVRAYSCFLMTSFLFVPSCQSRTFARTATSRSFFFRSATFSQCSNLTSQEFDFFLERFILFDCLIEKLS